MASKKGTNHTFKKSDLNRKDRPCPRTKGEHEYRVVGFGPVKDGFYDRSINCRRCWDSYTERVSAKDHPRTLTAPGPTPL